MCIRMRRFYVGGGPPSAAQRECTNGKRLGGTGEMRDGENGKAREISRISAKARIIKGPTVRKAGGRKSP